MTDGMPGKFMLRANERDYGPVDLETLRAWRAEGRVLPRSPVRPIEREDWVDAADVPGLFDTEQSPAAPPPLPMTDTGVDEVTDLTAAHFRPMSLSMVLDRTFRIYKEGFWGFLMIMLWVYLPSFLGNLGWGMLQSGMVKQLTPLMLGGGVLLVFTVFYTGIAWPVVTASACLGVSDLYLGQPLRPGRLFRRVKGMWWRVFYTFLFTYLFFSFWTVISVGGIVTSTTLIGNELLWLRVILYIIFVGGLLYMWTRLFINFMFIAQTPVFEGLGGLPAMRRSKELIRWKYGPRWYNRPMYKGMLIFLVWFVLSTIVVSIPQIVLGLLLGITHVVSGAEAVERLSDPLHPVMLISYLTGNVLNAAVQSVPIIGFVLLYYDTRNRKEGFDLEILARSIARKQSNSEEGQLSP